MAAIHHATKARAAKFGFEIIETNGLFGLRRIADEAVSREDHETAKGAADAAATLTDADLHLPTPIIEGVEAAPRLKSGVMNKGFHDLYTANGGGNGDQLDQYMRATFATAPEGNQKKPGIDTRKLREWGEMLELWNDKWNALNAGMQRMNLANRIRAQIRRTGEGVGTLGGEIQDFGITK